MLLILPFHLPSVFWWKDESLTVLLSGHHRHRPKKTVLTGLIALIFKIPLSHTKPSVVYRWSILVCRHGLCCHWKCKSCFGRSIVSFHQVILRIGKSFRWRVSKAFIVHSLFSAVLSWWKAWETETTINSWCKTAHGWERLFHIFTCYVCLLWHLYSLAARLWLCFDCEFLTSGLVYG